MLGASRIFATLGAHGVRYVVIGALGAMLHGSPLRTDDVDVCPDDDPANLARLAEALRTLEAREWDPRKDEFFDREWSADTLAVDRLWLLLTAEGPLDLVFVPAGTRGYKDLARDAVVVNVDDIEVPVAALADIIRSKEAAGREKDRQALPTLRRLLERKSDE